MGSKDFLGRGVKFPLQLDPKTGKIAMVSHEEDIEEAVGIIISTHRGERVMRPEFGSTIAGYVFEPVFHASKDSIAYDVRELLLLQEPRIVNVEVSCTEGDAANGRLDVHISYTVRSTNNRYNKVYPFYLNEGGAR